MTATPNNEAAGVKEREAALVTTDAAITEFAEEYEFYGEDETGREGYYTPNERERLLIEDAIRGWEAERQERIGSNPHG